MWRSRTCRCASPWIGPGWWGPTGRRMRGVSTSPTSPACRTMVVMAPSDEAELMHMTAHRRRAIDDGPIAFRYPRGEGVRRRPAEARRCPCGSARGAIVREGKDVAILSLGTRLEAALTAAEHLEILHGMRLHGRRRPLRQADRLRSGERRLVRRHRNADHHRGGIERRLRRPRSPPTSPNEDLMRPGFRLRVLTLPDAFSRAR